MRNKIIAAILVLVLILLVVFLRVRLISLSNMHNIAKIEAQNEILKKIQDRINKELVKLPQEKRDKVIINVYKDYLRQNRYLVAEKIREKMKEKKAFYQNDRNHTYLFGIDSYYWLRLIDNLIKKGHIGDKVIDGKNYDALVDMPIEDSLSQSMHIILGKVIYRIYGLFKINPDYEMALYFIPLLFSVLLAMISFFITKLLCQSNFAAFFAGLAVNLSPLLLQRTMGEWLDTDIYSVFFPLLIFGAFLFVFKSKTFIKIILGLAIFSLSCAFYASIWQGWWFIFDLLILCGFVFIINDYFSEHKDKVLFRKDILWLLLLFIFGLFSVYIFNGRESVLSFITEPGKLVFALKAVPNDNWPNVFLTVAELKKVSPYRIVQDLGGLPIFFVTILGSIYLVLFKKVIRDRELGIGFFCLFIWLGVLYYTSLCAVRFALLLIVPLGIMFGIIFDRLIRRIFTFSRKFSRQVHFAALGILVVVIYFVINSYVARSMDMTTFMVPMMNDAWYKSLTYIKDNSGEDAIINSWWDYGHWFKAIAKRRVLFDGKTQNSPIAFWMAKILTTSDEEEALGILRMLDISKNRAFDLLESSGVSHARSINILRDIIKLKEAPARDYLKGILDSEKMEKLISLLFAKNMPAAYFIASYDMLGKMSSISFIGNWDFTKGDIWINFLKKPHFEFIDYLKKEHGYEKEKLSDLLGQLNSLKAKDAPGWISRINNIYLPSISNKFKKDGNLLIFDNGMVFDLSNYNVYILRGPNNDIGIPHSVVYVKDGVLEEKILNESNTGFSVLLFNTDDPNSYKCISLDADLAKSMFVRMYFFKGEGLKYFKKIVEEKTPEGNSIFIYRIEWPGEVPSKHK